jgi:uncharacterized protein (DUF433 family)
VPSDLARHTYSHQHHRFLADTIVEDADLGSPLEEIHENYPDLSPTDIRQLIAFAHSHRVQRVP